MNTETTTPNTIEEQETYLLLQASFEIKSLRRQNELMAARLSVYDELMQLFNSQPARKSNGMMSPDVVSEIDKLFEERKNKHG